MGRILDSSLLYLASALVGSAYIWWLAIQGIGARDCTADIPVWLATMGAIAIGEYAAAAVVAALLLVGGLLESFVAARAGHALEALAHLLPDRVTVRRASGDVVIPLDEVRSGDIVLVRPFSRIAGAEQQHVDALAQLFTKYGLPVPANPGLIPVQTFVSLTAACQTGVDAEIADAALYDTLKPSVDNADTRSVQVFANLQAASLNSYLPAFDACN